MKALFPALFLSAFAQNAFAKPPSQQLVDSCLSMESTSKKVKYTAIETGGWHVLEREDVDSDFRQTLTSRKYGKDALGTWESHPPQKHGLVYNGKEIELKNVIRLDKRHEPSSFRPFGGMWGRASEGAQSYYCITFNFDGIGQSGSFQNVRGLYLVDRKARTFKPYYTAGDIRAIKK